MADKNNQKQEKECDKNRMFEANTEEGIPDNDVSLKSSQKHSPQNKTKVKSYVQVILYAVKLQLLSVLSNVKKAYKASKLYQENEKDDSTPENYYKDQELAAAELRLQAQESKKGCGHSKRALQHGRKRGKKNKKKGKGKQTKKSGTVRKTASNGKRQSCSRTTSGGSAGGGDGGGDGNRPKNKKPADLVWFLDSEEEEEVKRKPLPDDEQSDPPDDDTRTDYTRYSEVDFPPLTHPTSDSAQKLVFGKSKPAHRKKSTASNLRKHPVLSEDLPSPHTAQPRKKEKHSGSSKQLKIQHPQYCGPPPELTDLTTPRSYADATRRPHLDTGQQETSQPGNGLLVAPPPVRPSNPNQVSTRLGCPYTRFKRIRHSGPQVGGARVSKDEEHLSSQVSEATTKSRDEEVLLVLLNGIWKAIPPPESASASPQQQLPTLDTTAPHLNEEGYFVFGATVEQAPTEAVEGILPLDTDSESDDDE